MILAHLDPNTDLDPDLVIAARIRVFDMMYNKINYDFNSVQKIRISLPSFNGFI